MSTTTFSSAEEEASSNISSEASSRAISLLNNTFVDQDIEEMISKCFNEIMFSLDCHIYLLEGPYGLGRIRVCVKSIVQQILRDNLASNNSHRSCALIISETSNDAHFVFEQFRFVCQSSALICGEIITNHQELTVDKITKLKNQINCFSTIIVVLSSCNLFFFIYLPIKKRCFFYLHS